MNRLSQESLPALGVGLFGRFEVSWNDGALCLFAERVDQWGEC